MITLTSDEEAQLRPEYEKYLKSYCANYSTIAEPLSFESWWRAMADEAKERAKDAD